MNVALVPLGTPLLAGPGSIVAVMVAVGQAGTKRRLVDCGHCRRCPGPCRHVAHHAFFAPGGLQIPGGPGGIMLLTKISGLLLAAIATQLIMEGIFQFIAAAHLG